MTTKTTLRRTAAIPVTLVALLLAGLGGAVFESIRSAHASTVVSAIVTTMPDERDTTCHGDDKIKHCKHGHGETAVVPSCPSNSADLKVCTIQVGVAAESGSSSGGLEFLVPVSRDGNGISPSDSVTVTVAQNGQFALSVLTPNGTPITRFLPPITAKPPHGAGHNALEELTKTGFSVAAKNQITHSGVYIWVLAKGNAR
jgi:hypothetical protein